MTAVLQFTTLLSVIAPQAPRRRRAVEETERENNDNLYEYLKLAATKEVLDDDNSPVIAENIQYLNLDLLNSTQRGKPFFFCFVLFCFLLFFFLLKGSQLGTFCPQTLAYCYLEFKLRYLKNMKLFSIRVKELFEPIVLRKKRRDFALLEVFY